jgi:hypothetical protein
MDNYFIELNNINVSDKIEKKNGLSYVSWAYAWGEIKKKHPDATYTIYENAQGWCYHTDNITAWVKTGVTVNGIEHIEYLPIMDFKNKSIPCANITSFDVNKAIQRSLTKAVARHGLGLYVYAGEDLPEEDQKETKEFEKNAKSEKTSKTRALNKDEYVEPVKKPLQERYDNALVYLKSQTKFEKKSVIDSVNDLLRDLQSANKIEEYDNIMVEYNRITNVDDEIKY